MDAGALTSGCSTSTTIKGALSNLNFRDHLPPEAVAGCKTVGINSLASARERVAKNGSLVQRRPITSLV